MEAPLGLPDEQRPAFLDMHVHTAPASSDSMLDPDELVRLAGDVGLTGVNLTEHDHVVDDHRRRAFRERHAPWFVNFGIEVTTDLGHLIAVGLHTYLPGIHRAERLRLEVERTGGYLIVAHPFRRLFDPVTAMRTGVPFAMTPEQAAETMPVFRLVHGIEIANGANTPQENAFAAEVARLLERPGTGGSDAHSSSGIGAFATAFADPVDSEDALLEALHAGRFEAVRRAGGGRWAPVEDGFTAEVPPGPAAAS